VRLLLIEDEPEMAAALTSALGSFDMLVDHAPTLSHAEAALAMNVHDAILLDRQMPDGDGLELIPKLRSRGIGLPIIVLTARGGMDDRVAGLNILRSRSRWKNCWPDCAPFCGDRGS
jgi:DNA-binding response OmpR family regulator